MAVKTILVPLDGSESGKSQLSTALTVGQILAAHLEIFHARADSKEAVPLLGEGMSGAMVEEMIDLADQEAGDRSAAARKLYDEFVGENNIAVVESGPGAEGGDPGLTAAWREDTGREDELVASRGRLSDLIVAGRPRLDAERPSLLTVHAALFETGQPVLVAPPAAPAGMGAKIAIAYSGSAQAARASTAAMPFLVRAEEVTVFTVETEKTALRPGADEFVAYLAWHGISATLQTIGAPGQAVGASLLGECGSKGVDLLVMGAYTHSRLMRIILGGVTRHILNNAELPVLMAH